MINNHKDIQKILDNLKQVTKQQFDKAIKQVDKEYKNERRRKTSI